MIPTALAAGRSTAPLPRRGTGAGENTTTATPQPSGTCSITSSDSWQSHVSDDVGTNGLPSRRGLVPACFDSICVGRLDHK
jgi:hypothetical protein